jgi:hypothetical protein
MAAAGAAAPSLRADHSPSSLLVLLLLPMLATGSLAQQPTILGLQSARNRLTTSSRRQGAQEQLYVVLLKDNPVATYRLPGGMAATGLSSTVPRNIARSAAAQQYSAYLKQRSATVAAQALGSSSSIRYYYTMVVAGFAAGPLSSRQVTALKKHDGVLGVFPNQQFKRATISTPSFLALDTAGGVWSQVGGTSNAGDGVIVGVLDDGEQVKGDSSC